MSTPISLTDRHTDATDKLILGAAVEVLERSGAGELTVRAVARQAGISERTVFRYYASRGEFLDAVAAETVRRLQAPPPPATVEELQRYPRVLYVSFERHAPMVRSLVHTDLFERMRDVIATERWRPVRALLDAYAPHRSERDRRIAAANVCYYLSASTWHYYRFHFGFTPKDTVESALQAVRLAIAHIGEHERPRAAAAPR